MRALILIGIQNDFLPSGALQSQETIEKNLRPGYYKFSRAIKQLSEQFPSIATNKRIYIAIH